MRFVVAFEKAFDSVQSERLWNIMRSSEIPDKMVRVIEGMYVGFERTVVDGSVTSDWFMICRDSKPYCGWIGS